MDEPTTVAHDRRPMAAQRVEHRAELLGDEAVTRVTVFGRATAGRCARDAATTLKRRASRFTSTWPSSPPAPRDEVERRAGRAILAVTPRAMGDDVS